jgi:DnaK suppressor protein
MAKNYKTLELEPKYVPNKSEKYMSDTQKAYFFRLLNAQRAELLSEMDGQMNSIRLAEKNDSDTVGDDLDNANFEQEVANRMRTNERATNLLKQLDAALARLEDGSYGYSAISGDEIGLKRMLARPTSAMTIEEREEYEKKKH